MTFKLLLEFLREEKKHLISNFSSDSRLKSCILGGQEFKTCGSPIEGEMRMLCSLMFSILATLSTIGVEPS